MSKSNHKLEEKFVGANCVRPHFEEIAKKENGITLIALIITVIVLLILVGVTLSVTLGDNGLVNKAKEASEATEIAMDKELLLSAVAGAIGIDGLVDFTYLDSHLPDGFTGSNGSYTSANGHAFKVEADGTITYIGAGDSGDPEVSTDDLELLRRYFLGEVDEATGEREEVNIILLMENSNELFESGPSGASNVNFIDNDVIIDASTTLSVTSISLDSNSDEPPVYLYLQYRNNAYILHAELNYDTFDYMVGKSVESFINSDINLFGTYSDYIRRIYGNQR